MCEPVESWFKLDIQALQPSVPQQQIEYNFEESFNGGCKLRILPGDIHPRRLFVCDWELDVGLIVAYAFKSMVPEEDVSLWLRLESSSGRVSRLECGGYTNQISTTHRRLVPLTRMDLQFVHIQILIANENSLPATGPNDWQVRYYYVTSGEPSEGERVTDIGVGTQHDGQDTYLGAVHIHRGSEALKSRFS